MSEPVIKVSGISKKYILGHQGSKERYTALRDVISRSVKNLARTTGDILRGEAIVAGDEIEDFWALSDVSFQVEEGDVIGIIGNNGAGKSTLLKILSRISEPTSGRVEISGRVASLLEVGTGFHPELTGRENIFLNGAILGMSRREIRQKYDEIVAFAEVEKFLDTPVKRYSSGMYVRLAFAVAAHLEPEILIVDEVLAVGDAQFQKKCLGKMKDVARGGRTVLFVSHNMAAVMQLTKNGIVLNKGRLIYSGSATEAVEVYINNQSLHYDTVFDVANAHRKYPGTGQARLLKLRFKQSSPIFDPSDRFEFIATVQAKERISRLRFSITIFSNDGTPVGSCFGNENISLKENSTSEINVSLDDHMLAPGKYYCGIAIGKGNNKTGHTDYDVVLDTMQFEIKPASGEENTISHWENNWGRIIFNDLNQTIVI